MYRYKAKRMVNDILKKRGPLEGNRIYLICEVYIKGLMVTSVILENLGLEEDLKDNKNMINALVGLIMELQDLYTDDTIVSRI